MSKTKHTAAFRLSSDPIPLPARKADGTAADVKVTFDVGACFDLETPSLYRAAIGADLLGRDRKNARARQRLTAAFTAAYPQGEWAPLTPAAGETPATYRRFTDDEQDAYDAVRDTYESEHGALQTAAEAIGREVYLTTIGHIVIAVEGTDVESIPDPAVPADWSDWPNAVLKWIAEDGMTAAKESVRSKKS